MLREEILLCVLIFAKPVCLIIFAICAPMLPKDRRPRRSYRRYR